MEIEEERMQNEKLSTSNKDLRYAVGRQVGRPQVVVAGSGVCRHLGEHYIQLT